MKTVSIIIPVYNAERYLEETLDSIQSQSFTDWTCLLINDGSTDSSEEILRRYAESDNRFTYYTIPNNGCADIPIGYGMEKVSTPFCMFMGHDDVIEPDFIDKLVQRQKETGADVVSPTMIYCENELEGEIWRLPCEPLIQEDILSGKEACLHTIGGWQLTTNGMLYRARLNEGIVRGGYMNSDEYSSRQILFKAAKVVFSDAKYIYRQHTGSISRKKSPRLWERLYVDRLIEDFVVAHYVDNDLIKQKIVSVTFSNLQFMTYMLYASGISHEDRMRIRPICEQAYQTLHIDRLKAYMPKQYRLYMHGYAWFAISAVLYHTWRKIKGAKTYECK